MKLLMSALFILFAFSYASFAQADTLVIKLKNNAEEKIPISKIQKIQFENVTSVNEQNAVPSGLSVSTNYPNPFQDQTNIEFEIASAGNVEVFIFDNSGKQIKKLECNNCRLGKNSLFWNSTDQNNNRVESGSYYYEVRFNNEVISKKMLKVK